MEKAWQLFSYDLLQISLPLAAGLRNVKMRRIQPF